MLKKYRVWPNFKFEDEALKKGFSEVIGVDEVGRGALAGPVVAAAATMSNEQSLIINKMPTRWEDLGIDDSKRLSPKKREMLAKIIKKYSLGWGVGEVGVAYINKYGIVKATQKAMRQAISKLRATCHMSRAFVLVDAFHVKYIPGVGLKNQKAIIKGDQKSISIAAASIIAKVYRDKLMTRLGKASRGRKGLGKYHWEKNKGYGTREHQGAIRKYGLTRSHRHKFVEKLFL